MRARGNENAARGDRGRDFWPRRPLEHALQRRGAGPRRAPPRATLSLPRRQRATPHTQNAAAADAPITFERAQAKSTMFEATLQKASTLKKVIEAIKDLVTDGNIEVSETGMNLQAMDSSHVSLVSLVLHTDMFEHFRCDRNVTLGINLPNFAKILKCSGNDDSVTLKAQDDGENLAIVFESEGQERVSEFELKLMDIDAESLGIPDQDYNTNVKMSSAEFQRIVRDMTVLGDTCSIGCTKEGVKFSVSGDLGQGNITLRQTNSVDKEEEAVTIEMDEPVELNFALRYLGFFTKASPLCPRVTISMSPDVPIVVAYNVGGEKDTEGAGSLSFYLAPKIDEE
ncbi:unnamed protein product [Pelagomonas calceolata]|uniref:DNA sliding clamp PCNA n=1 Tax=Pelagomonas calceolata TaxID=35677 RepID=A0A8J2SZG7_9STRA|nr:unnamed protein product [Pelagomonas calceolata]